MMQLLPCPTDVNLLLSLGAQVQLERSAFQFLFRELCTPDLIGRDHQYCRGEDQAHIFKLTGG